MSTCAEVLRDAEYVVRSRKPQLLATIRELFVRANLKTVPDASKAEIDRCFELTGYRPDARILASAISSGADVLVTHDKTHFLGNPLIGPPETSLRVVTPVEAVDICRKWLLDAANQETIADSEAVKQPE
jgi:predicted nucleic acid-binding protein